MRGVASVMYFFAATCIAAVLLAMASGGLKVFSALLSLLCGAGVAGWALWQDRAVPLTTPRMNFWGKFATGLFALFALRCFLWLLFRSGDELRVLSSNNLGDMSIHITFIRYLANGAPFWPDNPICTGAPLTYPVGTDLLNAVLLAAGVDLVVGLIWIGLIGAACMGATAWRWGGAFAIIGILCNGGTAVFEAWFQPGAKWEFADYLDKRAWNSIPLAILVTQRGMLFALPAGLLLLDRWRTRFLGEPAKPGWQLPAWGELLLYAVMPLFHLHTFLFLSVVLGWFFVTVPAARKELLLFVGRALIPATLLALLVTGGFHGKDTIARSFGWTWEAPDTENPDRPSFFTYLVQNFGIVLPVLAALCVNLWRHRARPGARADLHIAVPALAVLVSCFFVRYAPWSWDNSKLVMWCWVALLPVIWRRVLQPAPAAARWAVCFLMFFTGFISLLGGMGRASGHGIAKYSVIDRVESAVREIPISERFVGHPTWNHPLLMVGRKMAMGFPGHIFSHGLGSPERDQKVGRLLKGEDGWRNHARDLGVRYMFWSEIEKREYPESKQPWREQCELVASGEWGELFDLTTVR